MVFVTDQSILDTGMLVSGFPALAIGIFMLAWPVRLARVLELVNRKGPGELIPHNDPVRVAASKRLRLQMRINGAWVTAFGLIVVLRGLGLI